jgi:hypothetical protein
MTMFWAVPVNYEIGDTVMVLTDTAIKNAKPADKPYKMTDERGLYLLVNKIGKYFRWDYRFAGKRKTLALGVYPDIRLEEAREKHEDLRRLLAKGIDLIEYKKQAKHFLIPKQQIHLKPLHGNGF